MTPSTAPRHLFGLHAPLPPSPKPPQPEEQLPRPCPARGCRAKGLLLQAGAEGGGPSPGTSLGRPSPRTHHLFRATCSHSDACEPGKQTGRGKKGKKQHKSCTLGPVPLIATAKPHQDFTLLEGEKGTQRCPAPEVLEVAAPHHLASMAYGLRPSWGFFSALSLRVEPGLFLQSQELH